MTNIESCLVALADPTRRRIFEKISRRPSAVGDLARAMPISRPAVSQHLKILSVAGLVKAEARGTSRIYRMDRPGIVVLRNYFDQFWNQALADFKAAAEKTGDKP